MLTVSLFAEGSGDVYLSLHRTWGVAAADSEIGFNMKWAGILLALALSYKIFSIFGLPSNEPIGFNTLVPVVSSLVLVMATYLWMSLRSDSSEDED